MHARQPPGVIADRFHDPIEPLVRALRRDDRHMGRHLLGLQIAVLVVVVWAILGPIFKYSDSWQLVINTGTTIVTFLMVFLIQNTQNRDGKALQVKLSELILALKAANNKIAAIENASPEELNAAQEDMQERAKEKAD